MIQRDNITQLAQLSAFQPLGEKVLRAMLDASRAYFLKSGEVLLYQGDPVQSFYAVQSGGVRLVDYSADGQCVALKIYGPGDVFGLLAISGSYPNPTQIEAIHDAHLIGVDGQDARRLMLEYPELSLKIIDLLVAHVHEGHDRIRHMAAKRVDRRLAQSLMQLCVKFGKLENGVIDIDIPLTQRDLAELISATVETVNRTLTLWEKQGILLCSHKRVRVLDYDALAGIGESAYAEQSNSA